MSGPAHTPHLLLPITSRDSPPIYKYKKIIINHYCWLFIINIILKGEKSLECSSKFEFRRSVFFDRSPFRRSRDVEQDSPTALPTPSPLACHPHCRFVAAVDILDTVRSGLSPVDSLLLQWFHRFANGSGGKFACTEFFVFSSVWENNHKLIRRESNLERSF